MKTPHYRIAQSIAKRFSQLPEVEAVAIAGSIATGRGNASSDVDVYVYPVTDLAPDERLRIAHEFSKDAQIVDYWGPGLSWFDPETGIEVETLFFKVSWIEEQVLQPLLHYQARTGYTTSFWHTIKVSQILFDRNGWFAQFQQKANQPYPDELVQAIVDLNYPLLRDIYPSYRIQIAKAVKRRDLIVLNRTVVGIFDSYFDILFAINRRLHPGKKRMLDIVEAECEKYPANMRKHVTQLLQSAGTLSDEILMHVDNLVDGLEELLQAEKLL